MLTAYFSQVEEEKSDNSRLKTEMEEEIKTGSKMIEVEKGNLDKMINTYHSPKELEELKPVKSALTIDESKIPAGTMSKKIYSVYMFLFRLDRCYETHPGDIQEALVAMEDIPYSSTTTNYHAERGRHRLW